MKKDSADDLKGQLEAYAAVARMPERDTRGRWAKWPMYAAATGAALAGASAASADIIYSGPLNISGPSISVPMGPLESFGLSFEMGFNIRFHFRSTFSSHVYTANLLQEFASLRFGTKTHVFSNRNFFAANFASGSPISEPPSRIHAGFIGTARSVLTRGGQVLSTGGSGQRGSFDGGGFGFLGFVRSGKTVSGSLVPGTGELGWVRLQFDPEFPGNFDITGWAYNTDGPIDAGQTSSTPEPGTLALMLLATGAAGVLAWKRRKVQAAQDQNQAA